VSVTSIPLLLPCTKLRRTLRHLRGFWREIKGARLPIFKLRLQRGKYSRWIWSVIQYVLAQLIPREDLDLGRLGLAPYTSKINCRVLIFTDLLHHQTRHDSSLLHIRRSGKD
jgi:hypothetical protein